MDFIQTVNKQVDKFGPGKHGFSAGNPAGGVPATYFSPDWADDLQQELINIVEAAGLVPAAATRNQVLLALRAAGVFTTPAALNNTTKAATTAFVRAELLAQGNAAYAAIFGAALAANGYQRLPSGLIVQWGVANVGPSGTAAVTLPIAFPLAGFAVIGGNATTATSGTTAYAGGLTTTGFSVSSSVASINVAWVAFGQ